MSLRRTRTALAAATLVAVGSLTACGSDDSADDSADTSDSSQTGDADDTAADDADDAAADDADDADDQGEDSGDDGGEGDVDLGAATGSGAGLTRETFGPTLLAAQTDAGSVHMEGTFGGPGGQAEYEGEARFGDSPEDVALHVELDSGGAGDLEMILVDQVLYMNFGQMTGGKFTEIDLGDETNPLVQQFGGIADSADPSAALDILEAGLTDLSEVGEEQVDGVSTTHYRLTVDADKALGAAGTDLPQGAGAQLPDAFTYDVWVGNDDGLMRRLSSDFAGIGTELVFEDWGEPVDVQAPPAAQITQQSPFGS